MKTYKHKKFFRGIIIIWMFFIYFLSSQNGEQTTKVGFYVAEIFADFFGGTTVENIVSIHLKLRKFAHVIVFLILGVISYFVIYSSIDEKRLHYKRSLSFFLSILIIINFGYFDEWHKRFVIGRHFQFNEVLLNYVSGFVGIIIAFGIDYFKNMHIQRNR